MAEQRYLDALGENLQRIMKYLTTNQKLVRYLYYTDKDPLATTYPDGSPKPDVTAEDVFQKQVLIIPVVGLVDSSKSVIGLKIMKGSPVIENKEFMDVAFNIEVFVPITQWILKSDSLRPFLIMGEIERSLKGKKINGLGKIDSMSFSINFLTEEMSSYDMFFKITQYD